MPEGRVSDCAAGVCHAPEAREGAPGGGRERKRKVRRGDVQRDRILPKCPLLGGRGKEAGRTSAHSTGYDGERRHFRCCIMASGMTVGKSAKTPPASECRHRAMPKQSKLILIEYFSDDGAAQFAASGEAGDRGAKTGSPRGRMGWAAGE